MGAVKLELRCPRSVGGVLIDPQPDWSFDNLSSELHSIEKKLNPSPAFPLPFSKTKSREVSSGSSSGRSGFVMHVDEMEDTEEDRGEEAHQQALVACARFTCDEFDISDNDDGEDELCEVQYHLMDKVGLVEGAFSELTHEQHLIVTEEIRNKILALETDVNNESKKFASALAQVKKYTKARQEMDRKLDLQYQRRIAEALDNHLTAVQRNHEHKSQIEERRIRDDAAIEEAKRREKDLQEEKLRQEKNRAAAEARFLAERKRAEEAKAIAAEAERKAAEEAAEKIAAEDSTRADAAIAALAAQKETIGSQTGASSGVLNNESNKSRTEGVGKVQQGGNILRCAENALKLEETRLQIYKEVAVKNEALELGPSSGHLSYGSKINKLIKQITGTKENVRKKVDQLTEIFFSSPCPQSISISMFANKMVDQCVNSPNKVVFAYAHVVVVVASKVPLVMDLLLAKLNRVCVYSVPKYISYSKSAFETKEAYHRAIGYKEEDGEMESEESYLSRIESYMKLYGALVQTEVEGVQNPHGLREGWAWLARFLNALPANLYTAVALQAFIEVAGFALSRRYKSQFTKLVNVIYRDFVKALKEQGGDAKLNKVIASFQTRIEMNMFMEEPEGRSLQGGSTLSSTSIPEPEYEQSYHHWSYHHPTNRSYY